MSSYVKLTDLLTPSISMTKSASWVSLTMEITAPHCELLTRRMMPGWLAKGLRDTKKYKGFKDFTNNPLLSVYIKPYPCMFAVVL